MVRRQRVRRRSGLTTSTHLPPVPRLRDRYVDRAAPPPFPGHWLDPAQKTFWRRPSTEGGGSATGGRRPRDAGNDRCAHVMLTSRLPARLLFVLCLWTVPLALLSYARQVLTKDRPLCGSAALSHSSPYMYVRCRASLDVEPRPRDYDAHVPRQRPGCDCKPRCGLGELYCAALAVDSLQRQRTAAICHTHGTAHLWPLRWSPCAAFHVPPIAHPREDPLERPCSSREPPASKPPSNLRLLTCATSLQCFTAWYTV